MPAERRFDLVSWRADLVAAVCDMLLEESAGDRDLSRFLVVFPHKRPGRYLRKALLQDPRLPKPCFLPETASAGELVALLGNALARESRHDAISVQPLDRAALLESVVRDLAAHKHGPLDALARLTSEEFFPWAMRLVALMEEFYAHGLEPADIPYPEEDVAPFAAALLEQLGVIDKAYRTALAAEELTTPGLDARHVGENLEAAAAHLSGKRLLVAGFPGFEGVAGRLFHSLWESGAARIVLHGDPALAAKGASPHWSCEPLSRLIRSWRCRDAVLRGSASERTDETELELVEGFDLHSQLAALRERLCSEDSGEGSAVVLPDSSMLMPVLHHLPDPAVNVSMGYPLERTGLARLLETCMRLQESSPGPGRYHWREVIDLFRHPYLKMLDPTPDSEEDHDASSGLRPLFHAVERMVRLGEKHTSPTEWPPAWDIMAAQREAEGRESANVRTLDHPDPQISLLHAIIERFMRDWQDLATLAGLADALERCCDLLIAHGGALWRRFPLDAECLHRLLYSVIPQLRDSRMSQTPFSQNLLFTILRQTLAAERAPFEAEPLTGLQVLGVLEARCLQFETVYVLDVTEDRLPGSSAVDPLFPDSLRRLAGLPTGLDKDLTTAHHFFRLVRGARKAVLLYQAGVSGGADEKKPTRSRFAEELLWEREQQDGAIAEPGAGPLKSVSFPVAPIPSSPVAIERTPAIDAAMRAILDKPVSPTHLDAYLACPARFLYEHVAGLREVDEVAEDGDPAALGSLVHGVLRDYLAPLVGERIGPGDDNAADTLALNYEEALRDDPFFRQLSWDRQLMAIQAGQLRLRRYIRSLPEGRLVALEQLLTCEIADPHGSLTLRGRLDRLDERADEHANEYMVLDYKTGSVRTPAQKIWTDETLWDRLQNWTPEAEDDPLEDLATSLLSVQLPAYIHLARAGRDQNGQQGPLVHAPGEACNAALVELKKCGAEERIFGKKADDDVRRYAVEELIPELFMFLRRHMAGARMLRPRPDRHCQWCAYAGLCRRGESV
ncbi:PD-(D/E)XK nuclease family protein [Oceanidesulfovibrio indonesiensis]|uniref:PD-(D/E)XK nuclease family protein n=1 Tax=Oceanidesulfovibrio indonesiensis TaxID=54767 RepID=A0A7M3MKI7_9BACT|nr:PD-(D/E)XK nuclease family protein [Oceanidesulfovibrio indonesiensis]TVM19912.1 PD-(D/E)XK nuclease family protein [Oceanidesulfovibrio indonesiensis]